MKELKRFRVLKDQEMKQVKGSLKGIRSNNCPSGSSSQACNTGCQMTVQYNGQYITLSGQCHYSGIGSVCACVK